MQAYHEETSVLSHPSRSSQLHGPWPSIVLLNKVFKVRFEALIGSVRYKLMLYFSFAETKDEILPQCWILLSRCHVHVIAQSCDDDRMQGCLQIFADLAVCIPRCQASCKQDSTVYH